MQLVNCSPFVRAFLLVRSWGFLSIGINRTIWIYVSIVKMTDLELWNACEQPLGSRNCEEILIYSYSMKIISHFCNCNGYSRVTWTTRPILWTKTTATSRTCFVLLASIKCQTSWRWCCGRPSVWIGSLSAEPSESSISIVSPSSRVSAVGFYIQNWNDPSLIHVSPTAVQSFDDRHTSKIGGMQTQKRFCCGIT